MRPSGSTRRKIAVMAVLASAALSFQTGCQNGGPRRMAGREPALSGPIDVGPPTAVVEAPPAPVKNVTWVDRHPLFYKPRDMYDKVENNSPVVKTAAAAVIGIPSGILGELRQIVVGAPPRPRY
jgi:hypothetical protein